MNETWKQQNDDGPRVLVMSQITGGKRAQICFVEVVLASTTNFPKVKVKVTSTQAEISFKKNSCFAFR